MVIVSYCYYIPLFLYSYGEVYISVNDYIILYDLFIEYIILYC